MSTIRVQPPDKDSLPTLATENNTRYYPNGMRVSDTAFPSYFPAANEDLIGNGKIIGTARLSVPVSQDNHGKHSLVVFCTDGIYTRGVDQSGNAPYANTAYFTPDVCVNRNTICEIGGAILFASDKGLMILTYNGVEEFCPTLNGEIRFVPDNETAPKSGSAIYNKMVTDPGIINSSSPVFGVAFRNYLSSEDFRDFLMDEHTCLAYISSKNKVLAFNGTETYFIDIKTRNVSKLPITLTWSDNNYPTPTMWVQRGSNQPPQVRKYTYKKVEFEYLTQNSDVNCLIQSRPIKVQQDDKCSYRLVLSGYFNGAENSPYWAGLVLLGSLDGEHWRVIGVKNKRLNGGFHDFGCLSGRESWKYVMFIFAGYLHTDSHIDSIDLTVNGRYNNKKR